MATLAIDSPLFKALPALGYWWTREPGELLFAEEAGQDLSNRRGHTRSALHISGKNRNRFVHPPLPEQIETIECNGHRYYVAEVIRSGRRQRVTLANAFPDPVAGDPNDYTWKDVTFIRYTRDIYPPAQGARTRTFDESQPAWRLMPHVIAWRARMLGEECFLIDVNESVPEGVLTRAMDAAHCWHGDYDSVVEHLLSQEATAATVERALSALDCTRSDPRESQRPNLELIAEELWQFNLPDSGVSAIVGPLIFCVSAHSHDDHVFVESLRYHLKLLESTSSSKLYFAGTSNHDTIPPARELAPLIHVFYAFLPRSVPMLFSGNEFLADVMVNKEFGFSSPELKRFRATLKDEALALFNDVPLNWSALEAAGSTAEIITLLKGVRELRARAFSWAPDTAMEYEVLDFPTSPWCLGYRRLVRHAPQDGLLVFANWDRHNATVVPWSGGDACVACWTSASVDYAAGGKHGSSMVSEIVAAGPSLLLPPRSVAVAGIGALKTAAALAVSTVTAVYSAAGASTL